MAASQSQQNVLQDQSSSHTAKNIPKDAIVMAAILKEMGVTQYEPRVINQMLEFAYRYVTDVLEDARVYSLHAEKKSVDLDDVQLAVEARLDHSFTRPPPREFLLEIARKKNSQPLPLIGDKSGIRLPPDRYCLTANNYKLKAAPVPVRKLSAASTMKTQHMKTFQSKPPQVVRSIPSNLLSNPIDIKPTLSLLQHGFKPPPKAVATSPMTQLKTSIIPNPIVSAVTKPTISTSTISMLPSMEETTACATAQHQEFPNFLKRKREDDEEDYDS